MTFDATYHEQAQDQAQLPAASVYVCVCVRDVNRAIASIMVSRRKTAADKDADKVADAGVWCRLPQLLLLTPAPSAAAPPFLLLPLLLLFPLLPGETISHIQR